MLQTVTIFGLGEAGSLFAADLAGLGIHVHAYDPAEVETPADIERHDKSGSAVAGAEVVLALTGGADAQTALTQAIDEIPKSALYADLSTNSAATKKLLAETAKSRQLEFVDIALMTTVPGHGLKTPALAAGEGASRYVDLFGSLGVPVEQVGDEPGDAAQRKLLRSVMVKGLAAVAIEAMRAGEKAGCGDWLWDNLVRQISVADETLLARLVRGTERHAERRLHEMEACAAMLEELGVDPLLTRATVESLRRIPEDRVPQIRDTDDDSCRDGSE
jgi:3-hydroxyisobutyrate dehydrogenase-like beta-hydroxyacid dehydrogenase